MEIHIKHSNNNDQVSAGFVHSEENKQIIAEFLGINAIRWDIYTALYAVELTFQSRFL